MNVACVVEVIDGFYSIASNAGEADVPIEHAEALTLQAGTNLIRIQDPRLGGHVEIDFSTAVYGWNPEKLLNGISWEKFPDRSGRALLEVTQPMYIPSSKNLELPVSPGVWNVELHAQTRPREQRLKSEKSRLHRLHMWRARDESDELDGSEEPYQIHVQ